ncbi:hypothetical protein GCM10009850_043370 [Nonomuraea monospora]|uniref:Uncharacterized protein n=1 Tax=Nonomuraea monospora TaxID=568818 RepID=A0ABN3CHI2_9ACTN
MRWDEMSKRQRGWLTALAATEVRRPRRLLHVGPVPVSSRRWRPSRRGCFKALGGPIRVRLLSLMGAQEGVACGRQTGCACAT